jgi:hypothetical protein
MSMYLSFSLVFRFSIWKFVSPFPFHLVLLSKYYLVIINYKILIMQFVSRLTSLLPQPPSPPGPHVPSTLFLAGCVSQRNVRTRALVVLPVFQSWIIRLQKVRQKILNLGDKRSSNWAYFTCLCILCSPMAVLHSGHQTSPFNVA